jgi:hypothetical protein
MKTDYIDIWKRKGKKAVGFSKLQPYYKSIKKKIVLKK